MDTPTIIHSASPPCSFTRETWEAEKCRAAHGFHVISRLADDGGIARNPAQLRLASDIVLRNGEERGIVFYRIAHSHMHTILKTSRGEAGMFARCVEGGLRKVLGLRAPFERARIRPIENERHFGHSVRYGACQEEHHGTAFDEAHDGSSLLDVVGLRLGNEWLAPRFAEALPRVTRTIVLGWAGFPDLDAGDVDVTYLREAAAAAFGVGSLDGRTDKHARARRVAVHVLDRHAPRASASHVLCLPRRCVTRYRAAGASEVEIRVVERQLRLRAHLAARRVGAEETIR